MTKFVEPEVYLVARPELNWSGLGEYLHSIGADQWGTRRLDDTEGKDAQDLVEFAGRMCYRSFEPGLNPNVTRIRTDQDVYLENILKSGHGSVLEHATFSLVLANVSRVLTHELIRHRVGVAISQESGRYIRIEEIPFWMPDWAKEDEELMELCQDYLEHMEWFQNEVLAPRLGMNGGFLPFHEKKEKTSFMRRFLPNGMTNDLTWTANIRTIRHTIELRTAPGAEEEIRLVFGKIARTMQEEVPILMADFEELEDGTWLSQNRKVLWHASHRSTSARTKRCPTSGCWSAGKSSRRQRRAPSLMSSLSLSVCS